MKKLAIYLKNCSKPVILSEEGEQSLEDITTQCKNVFISKQIFTITTKNDCLIGRPSEVQSILVSEDRFLNRNQERSHNDTDNN